MQMKGKYQINAMLEWNGHFMIVSFHIIASCHQEKLLWIPETIRPLFFVKIWSKNIYWFFLSIMQLSKVWGQLSIYIDGLVQDCSKSSAYALELLQSCTKPSICMSSNYCQNFHCSAERAFRATLSPQWQFLYVSLMPNSIYRCNFLTTGISTQERSHFTTVLSVKVNLYMTLVFNCNLHWIWTCHLIYTLLREDIWDS